jgi:hypothetical protein
MFRGRRGPHCRFSALVISTASEPQYVFGAVTDCLRLSVEMTSEHDPGCRLAGTNPAEKKPEIRSGG